MSWIKTLVPSVVIGFVTATYFLPEIFTYASHSPLKILSGYLVQALHDAVCLLFFHLYLASFGRDVRFLLSLNCFHGIIMMLFCYYKRCILTLLYNHMMGIDMCHRYMPIWQRLYNFSFTTTPATCSLDSYRNTYLWLNNHILQSGLVFSTNVYWLLFRRHESATNPLRIRYEFKNSRQCDI